MTIKVKERVFRDPVHGNIRVDDPVLLAVIDAPEFQRLRRIRQLGMCFNTYYGAENSRFQHSIGAMSLMTRILTTWRERGYLSLTPQRQSAAALAALLHDLTRLGARFLPLST
jgi:HD superfamily phosphohydrolase